jgi:hypothetical protein
MSGIFGILNLNTTDNQRTFVNTVGQRIVYDAINELLTRYNAGLRAAMAVFVETETTQFKERYMLPGGGRLQRRGGQAQSGAVKAAGYWDVAYPLEDFGAQLASSDVAMAYMTMADLDRHLKTIFIQNTNTVRYEILKALVNNTQRTFTDPLHGALAVESLANGDSVTYPPVLGSEDEATDDHYLESGYVAADISDTNNPFVTIRDELEEHFGAATGGENIVVFINSAQTAKVEALADFDEVPDRFIRVGDDTDVPEGLPNVPGRILGRVSGCWAVEWRWVPASYLMGIFMDAPRPLKVRRDPADTGLPSGLTLVATDETYPLLSSHYRHRFGIGVGNRLNGVVMELGNGGTYTIPTGYS